MTSIPAEHVSELEICFKELSPRVLRYAFKRAHGDRELAEDLMMEAFKAAALRWAIVRERPASDQAAWLCMVARRRHIDMLRRESVARENQIDIWSRGQVNGDEPDELVQLMILVDKLNSVIAQMPQQRRRVAERKWHRDMSNEEIARELGITSGGVSAHVTAARNTLRLVLNAHTAECLDGSGGGTYE